MTSAREEYFTPAGFGESEFTEKRSRFIGRVWPVATEPEALAHLVAMREKHWDATHNVYAYSIRNGQTRYSDDGEPQGTSGMPVLNVFQNEKVADFCCVVTRYYGGVLLGAGGLVRAYSRAAKSALDEAGLRLMRRWDVVLIPCPYALFERVKAALPEFGAVVESAEFGAEVMIEALVPVAATAACIQRVMDMSSGRVEPAAVNTVFRGVRVR